ncbi:hypothetical protein ASA1KI_05200 [Opitutales bacterium ASA1]|nr:hypothetical protein ASA1KI_05200 [Opitutales bacterium ASA1]
MRSGNALHLAPADRTIRRATNAALGVGVRVEVGATATTVPVLPVPGTKARLLVPSASRTRRANHPCTALAANKRVSAPPARETARVLAMGVAAAVVATAIETGVAATAIRRVATDRARPVR